MNDHENRIYNAGANGHQVLDNHTVDFAGDLALKKANKAVGDKLDEIDDTKIKQKASTKGATTVKGAAFFKMMFISWQCARLLVSYARSIGSDLAASIDFPRSGFVHEDFGPGKTLAKSVFDIATANQAAAFAAGYQLTVVLVGNLGTAITNFEGVENQPEAAASDKVAATMDLKKEVGELRPLFDDVFDLMVTYAESNTNFYNAVNDGFQINDAGVRHIALRVAVNDSVVFVRLANIEVIVVELNITKKTSVRGISDFSPEQLPDGNYTIQIKANGYTTQTFTNVKVEKGKMSRIDVLFVKV